MEKRAMSGYNDDHSMTVNDCRTGGGFQVQHEEQVSLELAEERERGIRQLEADVVGVHEIFRDLAAITHEQGEMIDSIEENVHNGADNVDNAKYYLDKARNCQEAARKKKCIILIVLVAVAATLGLIIYFLVK